ILSAEAVGGGLPKNPNGRGCRSIPRFQVFNRSDREETNEHRGPLREKTAPGMTKDPALPFLRSPEKGKVVSAAEAVKLIRDGDTLATGGFVAIGFAEEIAIALEERFLADGAPVGLTLVYAAGQGDGNTKGLNHLGHEGLVRRAIGGHWGLCPRL